MAPAPSMSATSPTWPFRVRWKQCSRFSRMPRTWASDVWCCSPAAARPKPRPPSGRCEAAEPIGRSCERVGSSRTSARATFWSHCLRASWHCRSRTWPSPFVDAEDIADVAVAALTQPGHAGQLYELTGPRALTFEQAVSEIAQAIDRDIRFVSVSPQDFRAGMLQAQVPRRLWRSFSTCSKTVLDGRNTPLANGVQRALGRPPRDFADSGLRDANSRCRRLDGVSRASDVTALEYVALAAPAIARARGRRAAGRGCRLAAEPLAFEARPAVRRRLASRSAQWRVATAGGRRASLP